MHKEPSTMNRRFDR